MDWNLLFGVASLLSFAIGVYQLRTSGRDGKVWAAFLGLLGLAVGGIVVYNRWISPSIPAISKLRVESVPAFLTAPEFDPDPIARCEDQLCEVKFVPCFKTINPTPVDVVLEDIRVRFEAGPAVLFARHPMIELASSFQALVDEYDAKKAGNLAAAAQIKLTYFPLHLPPHSDYHLRLTFKLNALKQDTPMKFGLDIAAGNRLLPQLFGQDLGDKLVRRVPYILELVSSAGISRYSFSDPLLFPGKMIEMPHGWKRRGSKK